MVWHSALTTLEMLFIKYQIKQQYVFLMKKKCSNLELKNFFRLQNTEMD